MTSDPELSKKFVRTLVFDKILYDQPFCWKDFDGFQFEDDDQFETVDEWDDDSDRYIRQISVYRNLLESDEAWEKRVKFIETLRQLNAQQEWNLYQKLKAKYETERN